jgi:hypothetical protein
MKIMMFALVTMFSIDQSSISPSAFAKFSGVVPAH